MSGISGLKREAIILRQLCYWFLADISLGLAIAQGLGVSMETVSNAMPQAQPA